MGLSGWLAGVAALGAFSPASALPQAPPEADVTAEKQAEPETETKAEITVTARKVEEELQEVPLSVQVLSGESLDEADLTRLYELQFRVPGLVVSNAGLFGAGFSLRGISDQAATGRSVAAHLNGVYLGVSNLALARMFDLERIEVLKGPQGTLYGRNATGGSLNYITRAPQAGRSVEIEAAYGTFATARVGGHVNVPVRNAAVRLAFIASEGDGYIRNSVDDRRFAENDFWGLRGSLRLYASDTMLVDLMAQHLEDDGASGELWTPNPAFLADPTDIRLTTVTLENPHLTTETDNLSLDLQWDLGFATLRSISGYARNEVRNLDDCAGIPILQGCVRGSRPATYEQWSQEIQLLLAGKGRVDGIVGAHYFEADSAIDFHTFIPSTPINDSHATERETAVAVFGQANLRLAERWSATGGLRLSSEEHHVTTIGTGVQDSPTLLTAEVDADDISWRLDLQHDITDETMLYAGVSTGFNSGGLITNPLRNGVPDAFGPEDLIAYEAGAKSQGRNGRWTLSASAFYYDFEEMQVRTITFDGDQLVFEVDNAAKAELYGVDTEGFLQVSDRLTVTGGIVWMPRREFVQFRNEETGDTLSGNKLVRAPEWTATAAIDYEHPLPGLGTLSGRLGYDYRSAYFFTKENSPFDAQDAFGLLNLSMRFESASERWYAFAAGRNLTDEDYFHQVFLQSSPGYPDTYEVGLGYRF